MIGINNNNIIIHSLYFNKILFHTAKKKDNLSIFASFADQQITKLGGRGIIHCYSLYFSKNLFEIALNESVSSLITIPSRKVFLLIFDFPSAKAITSSIVILEKSNPSISGTRLIHIQSKIYQSPFQSIYYPILPHRKANLFEH